MKYTIINKMLKIINVINRLLIVNKINNEYRPKDYYNF